MQRRSFRDTPKGAIIGDILTRPDSILDMERASEADRPAAEAVGPAIGAAIGSLTDPEKKTVGKWIASVLAERGWRPERKVDIAPGRFFRRGTVYRRAGPPPAPPADAPAWLAEARRAVAALGPIMTVDEFIAERRREAAREAREL